MSRHRRGVRGEGWRNIVGGSDEDCAKARDGATLEGLSGRERKTELECGIGERAVVAKAQGKHAPVGQGQRGEGLVQGGVVGGVEAGEGNIIVSGGVRRVGQGDAPPGAPMRIHDEVVGEAKKPRLDGHAPVGEGGGTLEQTQEQFVVQVAGEVRVTQATGEIANKARGVGRVEPADDLRVALEKSGHDGVMSRGLHPCLQV